jgi:hypothetical protein
MISLPGKTSPPYKYKGHGRLRIQSTKSIYFYIFIFTLCLKLFYYLLFLLHLYIDWGRSTWPCRLYSNPTCAAPTGSCLGDVWRSSAGSPGKGLTFTSLTGGQRSDQWLTPVWPIPTHGCCSESLYVLVDRTLVPTLVEQQWFLLGADSLMSLVPVHVITTMIAFSIHYLSFILWSLSMQPPLNWWW